VSNERSDAALKDLRESGPGAGVNDAGATIGEPVRERRSITCTGIMLRLSNALRYE